MREALFSKLEQQIMECIKQMYTVNLSHFKMPIRFDD